MSTCATCQRWQRAHNPGPAVPTHGECYLHLPKWLTGTDGPNYAMQTVEQDDTCSFHKEISHDAP